MPGSIRQISPAARHVPDRLERLALEVEAVHLAAADLATRDGRSQSPFRLIENNSRLVRDEPGAERRRGAFRAIWTQRTTAVVATR